MNHLAHFLLAGTEDEWRLGALLGDFRKGPIATPYPDLLSASIMLHRRIDAFCDRHPLTRQLIEHFPPALRRLGPILLDLGRDHFLSRHFTCFSPQPLADHAADIYALLEREQARLPAEAARFARLLAQHDLLCRYLDPAAVGATAARIIQRRLGPHQPVQQLERFWLAHYDQIGENFREFFPLLCDFAAIERERLRQAVIPPLPATHSEQIDRCSPGATGCKPVLSMA